MQTERVSPLRRSAPWGDRPDDPRYVLEIGKRAKAAEAPWRLATDPRIPDTVLDAGQVGRVTVRVASTRGPSHRYYGTPREDAAAVVGVGDRFLAAAVADGIGSVPGSGRAARDAVHFSLRYLHRNLPAAVAGGDLDQLLRSAVGQANTALDLPWEGLPATTLTVAVLSVLPGAGGAYPFAVARVGDSPAHSLVDGRFQGVFDRSRTGAVPDEVHTTRTDGLPDRSLASELPVVHGHLGEGGVLLLATDGLGTPLGIDDVGGALADRWREPPDPVQFLTQVQFRRKSYDDDRSAVAMWISPAGDPAGDPARARGIAPVPWLLPAVDPGRLSRPDRELPAPETVLDAGQVGELELRAASTRGARHRCDAMARHESVGVVTLGEDRVVAAVAQGTPGGTLHNGCREAVRECLTRARDQLVRLPDAPVEELLAGTVVDTVRPDTSLLVAAVDARPAPADDGYGFACARIGAGAAYRLAGGAFAPLPVSVDRAVRTCGRLAPGEALVLATDGVGLEDLPVSGYLGERWGTAGVPGPSEFLDTLCQLAGEDDRSAVVVWAVPGGAA